MFVNAKVFDILHFLFCR